MTLLARRVRDIEPSMIRTFRDAATPASLDLGLGQTDLPYPTVVHDAVAAQLARGVAPYAPNLGLGALRDAVGAHYGVSGGHVMITCGVQEALAVALLGCVDPGDEVLCPNPGFPAYPNLIRMAGARPVPYDLAQGTWQFDPDQIASLITPRTRAIVLNAPGNPTGQVFQKDLLFALMEVCHRHGIVWISDDIYEDYRYTPEPLHHPALMAHAPPGLRLGGLSKSHHLMGWRLGWMVGDPAWIEGLKPLHQHLVTCAPTIAQHAAIAALSVHHEVVAHALSVFGPRRQHALTWAARAGFSPPVAQGAFYLFLDLSPWLRPGDTSLDFARALLQEEDVVVIPGSGFGQAGEGWCRLAYTLEVSRLEEAFGRIDAFLARR